MSSSSCNKDGVIYNEELHYYDADAAERVVKFIQGFCRHVKGKHGGQKILLEEWQKQFVRNIFGWKNIQDGTRKHRTVYMELPRKNAKSTIGATLALYLLLKDGELGAEVYSCAADREQAGIVHNIAKAMVETEQALSKRCMVYKNAITHGYCTYKAVSAEAYTKHGLNASAIIFDELHAQPNRELWDVMTTSTGSREQPLTIAITTAGYDKTSICYELRDYAQKVNSGVVVDYTFMGVIYAAPQEAANDGGWQNPEVWALANPGLGTIVSKAYLEGKVNQAKHQPSFLNTFLRLHLNIWTGSETRWIPDEAWKLEAPQEFEKKNRVCYAALDLASTRDIAALALIWPWEETKGEGVDVKMFFFCPEDTIRERTKNENMQYEAWVNEGWLIATPGNVTDYEAIKSILFSLHTENPITQLFYDQWNSSHLLGQLAEEGMNVKPISQMAGVISPGAKLLERLALTGAVNHGNNPILRWMNSNVMLKTDHNGNIKPDKAKSTEKIDGIVALVMCMVGWLQLSIQEDKVKSIYNKRGLRVLGVEGWDEYETPDEEMEAETEDED